MASPEITLTHLDEPLFDGADATKRDLVDYLEAVADRIVPVLSGRPLSVIRVRAGQRPFMQKNLPDYAPPWIKTVSVWAESSHREVRYALCEDKPTLIWFANQRAVEYHVTLGTAGHLDRPSYLVLDIARLLRASSGGRWQRPGWSGKRCPGRAWRERSRPAGPRACTSTFPFRSRFQRTTRRLGPAPWRSGPGGGA